jgi:hypothetical protein
MIYLEKFIQMRLAEEHYAWRSGRADIETASSVFLIVHVAEKTIAFKCLLGLPHGKRGKGLSKANGVHHTAINRSN